MNTLVKILLGTASVTLLTITGCKKLDEKPYDFYAPENVYKTADDAEAAIGGVYSDFNSYDWFTKPYWEWLSEDEDHIAGASFALNNIGAGNYLGDYKTPKMFEGPYIVIARANTVLERIPAIDMDVTRKNRILGEAHFLWPLAILFWCDCLGRCRCERPHSPQLPTPVCLVRLWPTCTLKSSTI